MLPTEKPSFAAALIKTFRLAGKDITSDLELIADWLDEFIDYPMAALESALRQHRRASVYPPKPADIYRYLDGAQADDGRPGPDEAWGLLVRLIRDERETGVLTEEMRAGWQACQPILDLGDEVGARKCFLEVYSRAIAESRQNHRPARWTVTLGTDQQLRTRRLTEAVEARRIGVDQAHALMPGPTPVSLDQVAGLLEGPGATLTELQTSSRFRALSKMLRDASAAAEARRSEDRRIQRETEAEKKRSVQELIDQHQQGKDAV